MLTDAFQDSYGAEWGGIQALTACLVLTLSSCALAPNTVGPELAHVSHLLQHRPFTNHPENIGYQTIGVVAHWRAGGFYLDAGEAYNFAPTYGEGCAGMCGGREVFSARAGYEFRLK